MIKDKWKKRAIFHKYNGTLKILSQLNKSNFGIKQPVWVDMPLDKPNQIVIYSLRYSNSISNRAYSTFRLKGIDDVDLEWIDYWFLSSRFDWGNSQFGISELCFDLLWLHNINI